MATAIPGVLLKSIHGRIGNFVFYCRHGIQCVRTYVIPGNPDTEAQRKVRRAFGDAVRSWQDMTNDERNIFDRKARYLNMSGYNLYISGYMKAEMSAGSGTSALLNGLNNTVMPLSFNRIHSVSTPYNKTSRKKTDHREPDNDPG